MAKIEILMPAMGESVEEASIIKWLKNVGDPVSADEPIVEIATDKVDSDISSTSDGILLEQCVAEGDNIQVGQVVAVVKTSKKTATEPSILTPISNKKTAEKKEDTPAINPVSIELEEVIPPHLDTILPDNPSAHHSTKLTNQHFSPLVKSIAKTEGISETELSQIQQTAPSEKLSKDKLLEYIKNKKNTAENTPSTSDVSTSIDPTPSEKKTNKKNTASTNVKTSGSVLSLDTNDVIQPMGRVRKMIADNMSQSKKISPHATSIIEIDMTRIVQWRERNKNKYLEQYGQKITYTPIIIQALAQALTEFPDINISVNEDHIIYKKDINLGMAVAMESGDLIVPVIHNADKLNLHGITSKTNDLSKRARKNKLDPSEIKGGTYTMTNIGTFGNLIGTPIIPQPQVAIMAVGAIVKTPAVIETPEGDTIAIRHMMYASHTFDHRVVDGSLGGMFNFRVKQILESFNEPDLN